VTNSKQEDPALLEKIADLSLTSDAEPVLVPFTADDVSIWKEFCEYRRQRKGWDAWRQDEWTAHHPPHINELFNNWPDLLETPRLRLRLLREDDDVAMFAIMCDEKTMKYYGTAAHKDIEYTRKNYLEILLSRFKLRDAVSFAIILKTQDGISADEFIGHINVSTFDRAFNFAEIAYIMAPKYWGQGLATEAVRRVVDFVLEEMRVHKIRAACFQGNIASKRVLEKCGFKQEGYLRDNVIIDGEFVDEYLWAIIATDHDSVEKGNKSKGP